MGKGWFKFAVLGLFMVVILAVEGFVLWPVGGAIVRLLVVAASAITDMVNTSVGGGFLR